MLAPIHLVLHTLWLVSGVVLLMCCAAGCALCLYIAFASTKVDPTHRFSRKSWEEEQEWQHK